MRADKITIIGAGAIGLCCAIALQRRGYGVRIIDNSVEGMNCSSGNAGHFATEQIMPLANWSLLPRIPGMLMNPDGPLCIRRDYFQTLLPWFMRFMSNARAARVINNRQAIFELNSRAITAWQSLLQATKGQHFIEQKGHLLVFGSAMQGIKFLRAQREMEAFGVICRGLDGRQLQEFMPALSGNINYAIFYENTASTMSPIALQRHLQNIFLTAGGEWESDRVTTLHHRDTTFYISGDRHYECDHLLIAAGAWSHRLTQQLGYDFPLETERGYHLMLPKFAKLLSHPVASFDRSFIMTPMDEGLRLAGTVELAGVDAEPNYQRAEILLKHARSVLTLPETVDKGAPWMGCRPSLPDSLPVISQAHKTDKLYFAFGHQHLGLTQGALTGELIANLVTGQKNTIDLYPYRDSRF